MLRIAILVVYASFVYSVRGYGMPKDVVINPTESDIPIDLKNKLIVAKPITPKRIKHVIPELPKYMEALKNYTSFEYPIKDDVTNTQTNLQSILAVIDGIISMLAGSVGVFYKSFYEKYSTKLLYAAQANPAAAANRLTCVLDDVASSINKLKNIMEKNTNVIDICRTKPELCDQAIQAIIDVSHQGELKREGEVLIALGKLTGLYESKYKSILLKQDQPSVWKTFSFVTGSEELLNELIFAGELVRDAMGYDNCANTKLRLND